MGDEQVGSEGAEVCQRCGSPAQAGLYTFPLCSACREVLTRCSLPGWVKAASAVIALILVVAFARFPGSLRAGVAFERGKRAEAARDYGQAVLQYERVVERFPESGLAIARLGIAHYWAGNYDAAVLTLLRLEGREGPEELVGEVNWVMSDLAARYEPQQTEQGP